MIHHSSSSHDLSESSTPVMERPLDADLLLDELARNPEGGSLRAATGMRVQGWIVALTDAALGANPVDDCRRILELAHRLRAANRHIDASVTAGWWREGGATFLDVGILVPTRAMAVCIAHAFGQRCVAHVHDCRVEIVDVDDARGNRQ